MYVPALGVCRIGVAFGRREHEIATTLGKGDSRHSFVHALRMRPQRNPDVASPLSSFLVKSRISHSLTLCWATWSTNLNHTTAIAIAFGRSDGLILGDHGASIIDTRHSILISRRNSGLVARASARSRRCCNSDCGRLPSNTSSQDAVLHSTRGYGRHDCWSVVWYLFL
jgi:hypothetical protein